MILKNKFLELPLHDAILKTIIFNWHELRVELILSVFIDPNRFAIPCQLIIHEVQDAVCPHLSPWGDSSSVNSISEDFGIYKIQMQSGDTLIFKGKNFEFNQIEGK